MTPERWQQVKEILHGALQEEPGARPAFVGQACQSDPSLRLEVESLLGSGPDVAADFLKSAPPDHILLLRGMLLGSYEIVNLIGVGGMGEVYQAYDPRLERNVAIKVLPRAFVNNLDRLRRFEQEARAAAALNHPNILAIYDIGTTAEAGIPYVVSELLEGETLREQVKRGPLQLKKAIDYGVQIVHGLAAAHEKGIVHRDLKPENVFVSSDGRIKILDFGLAKLTRTDVETQARMQMLDTESGAVLGTVGYMSPEQVRSQPADQRSDIFAFGAILYEMLSGHRAFHKPTSVETMNAILNEDPQALPQVVPNLPPALQGAVSRCLEKNPEQRFQSARDIVSMLPASAETQPFAPVSVLHTRRIALRYMLLAVIFMVLLILSIGLNIRGLRDRLSRGVNSRTIRSLAVLPFQNVSGDVSQEYFADGMTDELITDLAKVTKLRVISYTSVERYKDSQRPLPEIARELGVDAVVEGTILKSGDHVRITAQLIDAQSDRHVLAESYERDVRDIVGLEDDVAKQIASAIGITLPRDAPGGVTPSKRAVDPAAYEAYLKGLSFFNDDMNCRNFDNALVYFQKAIDKDPNFAPAYSGLADTYFLLGDWACWHVEPFDKAESLAGKAIELEPGNAHAREVLAEIGFSRDWNWVRPAEQFQTAIDLDPNDAAIHSYYGMFLVAMGKEEEGLAEERKAQALDPFSDRTNMLHTWTLYLAHRFDEAIAHANHALTISASYGEYYWLGQCYEKKGMPDQAIEFYLKAGSGRPIENAQRRAAYQKGGLVEYWREDEQIRRSQNRKVDAVRQAMYYAHTGEKEKAIEQLQMAYRQHCNGLQFLKVEPVYDSLRDDPRFKDLLARLGL